MDRLMRRRIIMLGEMEPPVPVECIYRLQEAVTEANYDTEVQLFDEPKSFTILCRATFNNYNWTDFTQGVFGIATNSYFRFGAIGQGQEYVNNAVSATGNRYGALIMNTTSSGKKCAAIISRTNSSATRRFAIRYNHKTRKIEAISSTTGTTSHYYILPSDLISTATLKLLIGGAEGTVRELEVWNGCLRNEEIADYIDQ